LAKEIIKTFDSWEDYIRGANVATAILDYGKRWYEFQQWCKEKYPKQGGSMFAQFAIERFGMKKDSSSKWAKIGSYYNELSRIARKLSPDYTAVLEYTKLEPEQKERLLNSLDDNQKIDRKAIKALSYGHDQGDEWFTPRWIFDSLGIQFDIDVCAPLDLTHVTTPADKYFNEQDNGLTQTWYGTIWCNPPYSKPEPWALQCVEHNNGLLLTHIPMNAEWCTKVWNSCGGIRLFQAIEFVRPDGKTQRPGSWLQLAAFGEVCTNALKNMIVPDDVAENPRRVPSPMWIAV
jgi:hypothetical protein